MKIFLEYKNENALYELKFFSQIKSERFPVEHKNIPSDAGILNGSLRYHFIRENFNLSKIIFLNEKIPLKSIAS